MAICLGLPLPASSSDYMKLSGPLLNAPISILHQAGFTGSFCRQKFRWALTSPFHPCILAGPGLRYISVALSLESPPPGVTRRSALWCSDFPHSKRVQPS